MFFLLLKISAAVYINSILRATKESFFKKKKNHNRDEYEVYHRQHACYRGYIWEHGGMIACEW